MLAKFDPIRKRRTWLDFNLKVETDFTPEKIAKAGHPNYVALMTNSFVEAYLVGLADQVRPALEKIITWMKAKPEPDMSLFSARGKHWRDGWFALFTWRSTLGLCKWLSRGDDGAKHFAAALDAEWQSWQRTSANQAAQDRKEQQDDLSECLAMALAANTPAVGVKLFEAATPTRLSKNQAPPTQSASGLAITSYEAATVMLRSLLKVLTCFARVCSPTSFGRET